MRIILKSGAVIDTRVKEYTIKKSPVTDEITNLNWTMPGGTPELLNVEVTE